MSSKSTQIKLCILLLGDNQETLAKLQNIRIQKMR